MSSGLLKAWLCCLCAVTPYPHHQIPASQSPLFSYRLCACHGMPPSACRHVRNQLFLAAFPLLLPSPPAPPCLACRGMAPSGSSGCLLAHSQYQQLSVSSGLTLDTVLCLYHHLLACAAPTPLSWSLQGLPAVAAWASLYSTVSSFRDKLLLHGDSTASVCLDSHGSFLSRSGLQGRPEVHLGYLSHSSSLTTPELRWPCSSMSQSESLASWQDLYAGSLLC